MTQSIENLRLWLQDAAWRWKNDNFYPNKDLASFYDYYWNWFTESDGITNADIDYAWTHPMRIPNSIDLLR